MLRSQKLVAKQIVAWENLFGNNQQSFQNNENDEHYDDKVDFGELFGVPCRARFENKNGEPKLKIFYQQTNIDYSIPKN